MEVVTLDDISTIQAEFFVSGGSFKRAFNWAKGLFATKQGGNVAGGISHFRKARLRVHYDAKPHRFPKSMGPLQGNRPHLQFTFYLKGTK